MEPTEVAVRFAAMRLPSEARTPSSFDELFVHEVEPMIRLAISLVDTRERAEEIVQDAFERTLMVWRRLERPGAYLRLAVVNGCRSELHRRRIVRRVAPPIEDSRSAYAADSLSADQLRFTSSSGSCCDVEAIKHNDAIWYVVHVDDDVDVIDTNVGEVFGGIVGSISRPLIASNI